MNDVTKERGDDLDKALSLAIRARSISISAIMRYAKVMKELGKEVFKLNAVI